MNSIGFWQLPGPWPDVWRFNSAGATIALIVYAGGSIMALISGFRGLRLIEAVSLIAVPFLFNLLLATGADWHMAELGGAVTAHSSLPFAAEVAIGRAFTLWFVGEAMLTILSLISVNRLPRAARTHALFAVSGAFAAATPLIANAAQMVAQPFLAVFFSSACAALAKRAYGGPSISSPALPSIGLAAVRRGSRQPGSTGAPASSKASRRAFSWASSSSGLSFCAPPARRRSSTALRS